MKNRLKTLALTSCAVIALATAAHAQDKAKFDIAGGDLKTALQTFATQTSQEVLFSTDIVAGRKTKGLNAETDPQSALVALLDGTGLTYQRTPTGTLLVVRASDPQSGSAAGDGADGTVQALIVTAQKREENIQDVPIAMSAFTQEDLTRSQVAGGPDLMTQVPNFTFTKTNFSGYSIQIRGIGTQAISATTDAAVAVAFNNTPFIRNRFFEQEFYDLQRVEVLRGPQGTLYGRNATAGVVNIISAKPNLHEFQAKISGDIANYNSTRMEGMINLPLVSDKVALRIAAAGTQRDGFVKNLLTGDQTDGRDLWSARVSLGLAPIDNLNINLIYEHFGETDDRLRSGKQLCHKDLGPAEIDGHPVTASPGSAFDPYAMGYYSQGCLPASLYSPDSFQTPNGYAVPYFGAAASLGSPIYGGLDPYASQVQSRNLREIETNLKPEYTAASDIVELQLQYDLPHNLTLTSETGYGKDHIFSFEDYNRFDTVPNVFLPGGQNGNQFDIVDENHVFCDPQLGCLTRLAAGDLSTAKSMQFSQEFRLASSFDGPINFSVGANFLRYDTEDKYYVFINTLTAFEAQGGGSATTPWIPGVSDNGDCIRGRFSGFSWSNPNIAYGTGCAYIDPNDIHNLNDQGRNYFLSKNPYGLLSYAAFGELYYQITPTLKVTGGLRWTDDKKTAPQMPSWILAGATYGTPTRKTINLEWKEPTGRLAVDWKPGLSFTDETLLYASYAHGYKAGGANPPPAMVIRAPVNIPFEVLAQESLTHPETFKAEFVDAYEFGAKNTILDGRMTFNVNAFYYDYTGYQISEIVDRSAVNLNFDAKIWGSELEMDWRPIENVRLGFKGGYENTRVADGSKAIDLIDRTAGDPNYIVKKPFPTIPSNCIVPVDNPVNVDCVGYILHDNDALNVPNNGEGVLKDLSGNAFPNAPKFTATITADYTVPLPNEWLMTLHTDLYYQSEAWTRIFNDPGYDKLKAYNNINLAAIFANEDAGWQIMAYVKNVLDRDSITGAFLNSDDTGLTTNVFLTEPRLYGLRFTKQWSGSPWWASHAHTPGAPYPIRLEVEGYYGIFDQNHEILAPADVALFPAEFGKPLNAQKSLDWGSGGGAKFTWQPNPGSWRVSAAIRYGRADGDAEAHNKKVPAGGCATIFFGVACFDPRTGEADLVEPYQLTLGFGDQKYDFITTSGANEETHAIADFMVGKDVGLGTLSRGGTLYGFDVGLSYAHFKSVSSAAILGKPDIYLPPQHAESILNHTHVLNANASMNREFKGAGPAVSWEASLPLFGDPDQAGRLVADVAAGGSVLFGKQTALTHGYVASSYRGGYLFYPNRFDITPPDRTDLNSSRSKSRTVPSLKASAGISYELGDVKVSGGYRWERYFNVIDGGLAQRKIYDRDISAAYFKVSVGFGG